MNHHDRKRKHDSRSPPDHYSLRELKEKARKEIENSSKRKNNDRSDGRHHHRDDEGERHQRYSDRFDNKKNYRNRSPDFYHSRRDDHRNNRFERRKQRPDEQKFKITSDEKKSEEPEQPPPEIKPNFELTGALARDTNTFNGIVVKYNQPPEAKKPNKHWRLYPFKGSEALDYISIHNQSAYLLGRERKVADIPIDHPSCSKQHAVIQFRCITFERPDGSNGKATRPYIIDLESANGTYVNNEKIEPRRYVELLERDVIKFGFSTREYVLLHEHSAKDAQDDDDNNKTEKED